jgi:hypothetical protein
MMRDFRIMEVQKIHCLSVPSSSWGQNVSYPEIRFQDVER